MVLSVAGNFKREEMLELLNHYFGRWQAKAPYAPLETKASYHQSWIQKKKMWNSSIHALLLKGWNGNIP